MKKIFLLNAAPSNTTALLGHGNCLWIALEACRTYATRLDFCPTRKKQASCLFLPSRLRSFSPPSMAAFPRYRSALSTVCESLDSHTSRNKPPACFFRAAFVRFRRPPWRLLFAIAQRSLRETSLRLAHQKQTSCLLLVCRLRSFSPPSVAAFPRYRSALSTVCESLDSHTSRNKPPACFFRAAFVRFHRPPLRLLFAITQRSLREASLRLPLQKQASCLLLEGRLRSLPPPSMAAFPRYCSALSSVCESLDSPPPEASLLLASGGAAYVRFRRHPWRLFFAIAQRSLREASLRLPLQKQASCLLLPGRLRSFSPPSMAAFPRYCSALSTVCESLDSHPSRNKPPACFFRAAFVRFRRPPWRLFFAIAQRSLREASLRLTSPLPRCQNAHAAQLCLSFCRLVSEKNHQKSPRSLKTRQTPKRQQWIPNDI